MLTDLEVQNAKPKPGHTQTKLADGDGLFVRVTIYESGWISRLWQMKYRVDGKERLCSFGSYPEVSIAEARDMRKKARRWLSEGHDPVTSFRVERAEVLRRDGLKLRQVGDDWLELKKPQWSPKHHDDVKESLTDAVYPAIGDLPVSVLTQDIVFERVLKPIEKAKLFEKAHRVQQRLHAIYVSLPQADRPPCDFGGQELLGRMQRVPRATRQPAITDLQVLRGFLAEVERMPAHPITLLANRFVALTYVRMGTLGGTPWDGEFRNLDSDDPIWDIPGERLKAPTLDDPEEHALAIPLCRQAVDVLAVARTLTGQGRLVFPNDRWPDRPMTENTLIYLYYRAGFKHVHCVHGWRASFSTNMNERYPELARVIDFALGHKIKGVEGRYNRAAFIDLRRKLAQEWADMLLDDFPPAEALLTGPRRVTKSMEQFRY
jgi:integrase